MQKLQWPQPDSDAQAASQKLVSMIRQEIDAYHGWISFARYMEMALYTPQWGYYTGGAAKLGSAGDFITAPEISPLFGGALANFAMSVLPQTENTIMEFGAGTGQLAFDILTELHHQNRAPTHYYIVELSGELRARQEQLLAHFPEVVWLEKMPNSFAGLVLGNEVLDAMPVQLVKKTPSDWKEVGVIWEEGRFQWLEKNSVDTVLVKHIPEEKNLPIGYLTEVHTVAQGFMRSVARMLRPGAVCIFIDYGFHAEEYYLDQRNQGTLMCHYRHHAHTDPFYWPGLQDITSHIDFSAMNEAAQSEGLALLQYETQANFLLKMGIGNLLLRTSPEETLRYLPQAKALQKLVSPAEMGELFKVIVFERLT